MIPFCAHWPRGDEEMFVRSAKCTLYTTALM
jgi:hypothetical protein